MFCEYNGEKVYFCCGNCTDSAAKDPAKWRNQVYAEAQAVGNAVCPVTGEDIGESEEVVSWQGHEVAVCCSFCVNGFAADAEGFTKQAIGSVE